MTYQFSSVSNHIVRSEIRELLKWSRRPGVISFGGGLPDPALFPTHDIIELTREVLEKKGYLALQYGPTQGEQEMLEALVHHMSECGDEASVEQVCVTSSSQQGIDLLSLLFLDEGAPIIMEIPSYLGAVQAFRRCSADMHGIPLDDDGMDIGYLRTTLDKMKEKGEKPRFIYTVPDFQNPSGITLSLERRHELVKIAHENEIPLVEDSPYRELSFTGEVLPSLWTVSGGKGVIMLKTFSKILFPGMRMGWLVAEESIADKIIMLKQSVDLCTPSFNQLILAEYLKRGKMKKTIKKAIQCYKPKCAAMLKALNQNMPKEATWSEPSGGMFLWLKLPERIDTRDIFKTAVEHQIAYVIGHPFHCDDSGKNTLRLNFSFPTLEQIESGIKRLSGMIREVLQK